MVAKSNKNRVVAYATGAPLFLLPKFASERHSQVKLGQSNRKVNANKWIILLYFYKSSNRKWWVPDFSRVQMKWEAKEACYQN